MKTEVSARSVSGAFFDEKIYILPRVRARARTHARVATYEKTHQHIMFMETGPRMHPRATSPRAHRGARWAGGGARSIPRPARAPAGRPSRPRARRAARLAPCALCLRSGLWTYGTVYPAGTVSRGVILDLIARARVEMDIWRKNVREIAHPHE